MKALVVDDSRAMRRFLAKIVFEVGFTNVAEAAHGREALDVLSSGGAVDLMLVDWNMPEMDGLELVEALRALAEHDATRVIMVTSENDLEHMTRALEAGADEYLMKPFQEEDLLIKLEQLGIRLGGG